MNMRVTSDQVVEQVLESDCASYTMCVHGSQGHVRFIGDSSFYNDHIFLGASSKASSKVQIGLHISPPLERDIVPGTICT